MEQDYTTLVRRLVAMNVARQLEGSYRIHKYGRDCSGKVLQACALQNMDASHFAHIKSACWQHAVHASSSKAVG